MKGQSQGNLKSQKRRMSAHYFMILSVSLGLEFCYVKNSANELLKIMLAPEKVLYLDFAKWTSDVERAVIYVDEVQLQVNLADVKTAMSTEGNRMAMLVSEEIKKWIEIFYTHGISFKYCPRDLIVEAQKDTKDDEFKFTISFDSDGCISEISCRLHGVTHYHHYQESPEWTFYRLLDMAAESKDDQVS